MNITWGDTFKLTAGLAARDYINKSYVSAEARMQHNDTLKQLEYQRERDAASQRHSEEVAMRQFQSNANDRLFREEQARLDRMERSEQAALQRLHEEEMQRKENEIRQSEVDVQYADIESRKYIAELGASVRMRNADLDREAQLSMHSKALDQKLAMHAKELNQQEQLELRRLRVQRNLAEQNEKLQKFLAEQGIKSTKEIERFKALAIRETQILLARENAQNILQDRMVQEALKSFPLNISPLVLLKNRPHSLSNLLRFSAKPEAESVLPHIAQVYDDVRSYSMNPEALNIFIAPIHISSTVANRDNLNEQIWDMIYQNVESFFTANYNRQSDHPVILYPTAWKDSSSSGQHASETLHFFLRDMPCLVIEPRFDGHTFGIIMSGWNNGYLSTNHIRTQTNFDVNIHLSIIERVYSRSIKALEVLNKIDENLTPELAEKKKQLKRNVDYYDKLNIQNRIETNSLDEIESLGVYDLFSVDPMQDLKSVADAIASLICVNLAVLSDLHHLQATDTLPIFPKLFKSSFPGLYDDKSLRELIASCYEQVLKYLRSQDASSVDISHRRELERVRELQIENIAKELDLIGETEIINSIESRLQEYMQEKTGEMNLAGEELWLYAVEHMTVDDIPFFQEILPNIQDRRTYKRIDKKIAELQR